MFPSILPQMSHNFFSYLIEFINKAPTTSHSSHPWEQCHALLTPDNHIDILACRVAHVVDSRAVVEAPVSRCYRP